MKPDFQTSFGLRKIGRFQYEPKRGVKSAGYFHSMALREDGTVIVWGDSTYGQGNTPEELIDVTSIDAGGYHNVALKADGSVIAWGRNNYGQGLKTNYKTIFNTAEGKRVLAEIGRAHV